MRRGLSKNFKSKDKPWSRITGVLTTVGSTQTWCLRIRIIFSSCPARELWISSLRRDRKKDTSRPGARKTIQKLLSQTTLNMFTRLSIWTPKTKMPVSSQATMSRTQGSGSSPAPGRKNSQSSLRIPPKTLWHSGPSPKITQRSKKSSLSFQTISTHSKPTAQYPGS
jgi:hypothetical protein